VSKLITLVLLRSMTDIPHEWGVEEYGRLLEIGGGKERMTAFFEVCLRFLRQYC
jgi:hypothetical protein